MVSQGIEKIRFGFGICWAFGRWCFDSSMVIDLKMARWT